MVEQVANPSYQGGGGDFNSGGSAGPAAQNGTSNQGGVGGNLGQNGGDSLVVVHLAVLELLLMVGHIELVNQVMAMETFEVLKLIKAMQDLTQQPSYVVKNFDIDTGAFDVYYNDGALKNDDWYGPYQHGFRYDETRGRRTNTYANSKESIVICSDSTVSRVPNGSI